MPYSILIILLLFFSSCSEPETPSANTTILSVNPENKSDLKFSNLFEELDYIFLNTEGTPLGVIRKIVIEDEKIFVLDGQANIIYIFDLSGDLQFMINRIGKGEGEYTGMSDFGFDHAEKMIYILDRTQMKMIKLKIDGEFLDEIPIPEGCSRFALLDNHQLVFYAGYNLSYEYHYKVIDSRTGEVGKQFMKIDENKSNFLHFITYSNFYTGSDEKVYSYQIGDEGRVYRVTPDTIQLGYKIDFGEHSIPDMIMNANHKDVREFVEAIDDQYAFRKSHLFETNQYYLFTFTYLEDFLQCIYDKSSNEYVLIPRMVNDMSTDIEISERGLFAQNMFKGAYKDKVYGVLDLDAILFNSESQTINGRHFDENSNPVVYIGRLKEKIK